MKEANLHAKELSKPLFKNSNSGDNFIKSTIFKGFDLQINLKISDKGAHAVLADKAENVTADNVSLHGKLEHTNNNPINNVGGLFGGVKGNSRIQNSNLNDLTIQLNKPSKYATNYNSNIGGFIGNSTGELTAGNIQIKNLTIHTGFARNVGGMIGIVSSGYNLTKPSSSSSNNLISGISILNAERNVGSVLGVSGGENTNASATISDLNAQINNISSFNTCSGGLIGYKRSGALTLSHIQLESQGDIHAGKYAGGLVGYYNEGSQMALMDIHLSLNNVIVTDNNNKMDYSFAGGLFGSIKSLSSNSSITNIYLLANHIYAANNSAGGFIGALEDGDCKITLDTISNFVKKISASDRAGGLIGYVREKTPLK